MLLEVVLPKWKVALSFCLEDTLVVEADLSIADLKASCLRESRFRAP